MNAAFELKEQISQGLLPEPDYIYIPLGSAGTAGGLILGAQLAGLKSKIIPVAISGKNGDAYYRTERLAERINEAVDFFVNLSDTFPDNKFSHSDLEHRNNFANCSYAQVTDEVSSSLQKLYELGGVKLEGTYTGKALTVMFSDIASKKDLKEKNILFWNTFCYETFEDVTNKVNYKDLPVGLHKYFDRDLKNWAEQTLQKLTIEEKVGQLFMVGFVCEPDDDPSKNFMMGHYFDQKEIENLIKNFHIGGLIFFQGSAKKQAEITNKFQMLSKYPLLVGQDCEWGLGMRLSDAISFPKNIELGKIPDESLLYKLGKEIGEQCRAIGVHVNFAPVVDINSNPDNPIIGDRSFGSCKKNVARKGKIFASGLQDGGVIACAKHFPGHGDTSVDSHLDLPVILHSVERLEKEELYPFKILIDSGVGAVMTAHLSIPALDPSGLPATVSRLIVTDLLRKKLGFDGLIFTDAMSMKGITAAPPAAALMALNAGNDILLCPLEVKNSIKYLVKNVKDGKINQNELDAHVLKILQAKEKLGLHKNRLIETDGIYEKLHSKNAEDLKEL
jgi:beta-glucosidase-like glycosyl hydrolase